MSDENEGAVELTIEEKMANLKAKVLSDVIFCSIGWFVFWLSMMANLGPGNGMLFALLGVIIGVWPLLGRFMKTRSWTSLFFWRDYEVVTTYGDGRKESDSGAQSSGMKLLLHFIYFMFILFVLAILMPVRIIFYIIKYTYYFVKVSVKPSFLSSAYPLLIFAFVWLIAGMMLASNISDAIQAGEEKKRQIKDYAVIQTIAADIKAQIEGANSINFKYGIPIEVNYTRSSDITEVTISESASESDKSEAKPGTYYFTGKTFTRYEGDNQYSQSDIDFTKKFIPSNFFFTDFDKVKKNQLSASRASINNDNQGSLSAIVGKDAGYLYGFSKRDGKWQADFYTTTTLGLGSGTINLYIE
jgi:hypothetical protein